MRGELVQRFESSIFRHRASNSLRDIENDCGSLPIISRGAIRNQRTGGLAELGEPEYDSGVRAATPVGGSI
jgi:hypothetical protein